MARLAAFKLAHYPSLHLHFPYISLTAGTLGVAILRGRDAEIRRPWRGCACRRRASGHVAGRRQGSDGRLPRRQQLELDRDGERAGDDRRSLRPRSGHGDGSAAGRRHGEGHRLRRGRPLDTTRHRRNQEAIQRRHGRSFPGERKDDRPRGGDRNRSERRRARQGHAQRRSVRRSGTYSVDSDSFCQDRFHVLPEVPQTFVLGATS